MPDIVFLKAGQGPIRVPFRQVQSLDAGGSVYPSGKDLNVPVIRGQEALVRETGERLWAPVAEWWQFRHPEGACLQLLVREVTA